MGRKSNVFLLAYAIFLLFIGFFASAGVLSKISLGAAIAGVCFAISDFCLAPGYEMRNELAELATRIDNEKSVAEINDLKKRTNKVIFIGEFMLFVGMVMFLVITVCYDDTVAFFRFIEKFESKATIIAFAVIAVNYWLQDWIKEKNDKIICTMFRKSAYQTKNED